MHRWLPDVAGWLILLAGLLATLGNQLGWFQHADRAAFLRWALEAEGGLAITDPIAAAFVRRFPPPPGTDTGQHGELTHITKTVMRSAGGGAPVGGFISYMHRDTTRTGNAATFEDVRRWASETWYGWFALALTTVGATITIVRGVAAKRREPPS